MDLELVPNEVILHIFTFLPLETWFNVMIVSKRFLAVGNQQILHVILILNIKGREGFDPSINNNAAIIYASKHGKYQIVDQLLKDRRVDPTANHSAPLRIASELGHVEVVKLLLKDGRSDPSAVNNYAIRMSAQNGHLKVCKELMTDKRIDPSDNLNYAIRKASEHGHTEIVRVKWFLIIEV